MSKLAKFVFALFLLQFTNARNILLDSPGNCVTQTGTITVQPSCNSNYETFTVTADCCSATNVATLIIDASNFNATSGDCCKRCIGQGDQHAEDSEGNQVTLGPCMGRALNSCKRMQLECDPNLCTWKGGSGPSSCQYNGPSPQIQLFNVLSENYGVNFTLGPINRVASITPFVLNSNIPLGTISGTDCNFVSLNTRPLFSAVKSSGSTWVLTDIMSDSKVIVTCDNSFSSLDYVVSVRNDIIGLCENSLTNDPIVNSWIGDYKLCPGSTKFPPTLISPTKYSIKTTLTNWANLVPNLPLCTPGWIFIWISSGTMKQVAVPVGTKVSGVPNSLVEPGLYNSKQTIKYVPAGPGCGCAPNPGSTLQLNYGGNPLFPPVC